MIADVAIGAVDAFVEVPAPDGVVLHEERRLHGATLLPCRDEPALFLFPILNARARWLSTGPFDPAQHECRVRIGRIEPRHPFPALVAAGEGGGNAVNIEEYGAELLDLLVGAGEVLDEIIPLEKGIAPVVARGGVLDAPHGATAVAGDVPVRPELVAGQ